MDFERYEKEQDIGLEVMSTNSMLCKDCIHRMDKSAVCKKYSLKPLKVFRDRECDSYERENKVE